MSAEQRLVQVERQCRILSAALCAALALAGVTFFVGATDAKNPTELTVTRLNVVDKEGKVRMSLGQIGSRPNGAFALQLFDSTGKRHAKLLDIGQLDLASGHGRVLLITEDNVGSVQVNGAGQRPRAALYATNDHAALTIFDTQGARLHLIDTPRIDLPLDRKAIEPFGSEFPK